MFRENIIFTSLRKYLRGQDGMFSRARFGPRAVVVCTPLVQNHATSLCVCKEPGKYQQRGRGYNVQAVLLRSSRPVEDIN